MKRQNLTFEVCLTLAKEFLTTKERENYYEFNVFNDDNCEEVAIVNQLSDTEVAAIRALKEKYGDEFAKHLVEVYDNSDFIHDLSAGCEILDIDTDTVWHRYGVAIHELQPDGKLSSIKTEVTLSDDDYVKLLAWHLYDEHLTMNLLRHREEKLYNLIMDEVESHYTDLDGDCLFVSNPFLVTLDEAKADSELIVAQHNIERTGAYLGI